MKKRYLKKIPKFRTENEERNFWTNADTSEYFDFSKAKRVSFPNLKPTKRLISLRLEEDLVEKAKEKAAKLHIPYQTFMRKILHEGIDAA